jgi:hypothetical protein
MLVDGPLQFVEALDRWKRPIDEFDSNSERALTRKVGIGQDVELNVISRSRRDLRLGAPCRMKLGHCVSAVAYNRPSLALRNGRAQEIDVGFRPAQQHGLVRANAVRGCTSRGQSAAGEGRIGIAFHGAPTLANASLVVELHVEIASRAIRTSEHGRSVRIHCGVIEVRFEGLLPVVHRVSRRNR